MGFRYRKSINLGGGFRVNLSKSGVGYSWGTEGYRITKTASGKTRQTVYIPGTGLSYVEESGGKRKQSGKKTPPHEESVDKFENYSDVKQIESSDASNFRPAEYSDLFNRIRIVRALNVLLIIGAIISVSIPVISVLCLIGVAFVHINGKCYIDYEFDESKNHEWSELYTAWENVASSEALRQITLTAKVKNKKVNAGIENAVDYVKITAGRRLPWFIKSNVTPVVFNLKEGRIAILPDRMLLFTNKKHGAIDYKDVHFKFTAVGFLESGKVPKDAELVKYVWGYANKDG